eukprot:NODE_36_length_31474_cov_0.342438.p17 type:complete len:233 gc:universal NODE_36_length_31474_cov_0.342438:30153-29455(-)
MLLLMIALIFAQFKVGCNNPRIRKEIRELSKQEWSTVKRVVNQLKKNGVFRRFAEIHHSFFSRFHNNVYFMPWHRQFIYNFETEMRKIDANVTLPYWNWAKDADKLKWNFDKTEIFSDYYLGSVGPDRCVKGGPFDYNIVNYPFRHCISRRLRRDILPSGGGVIANIVATPNGVEYFGKLLENGPHALFHMHLGGDMGVSYSNNDFAFYVHHTFSDYVIYPNIGFITISICP